MAETPSRMEMKRQCPVAHSPISRPYIANQEIGYRLLSLDWDKECHRKTEVRRVINTLDPERRDQKD